MESKASRGNLTRFIDLAPGGLYVFQGLESSDTLGLWTGTQTTRSEWKQTGNLVVGDTIIVITTQNRYIDHTTTRFFVDVLCKTGLVWFGVDIAFVRGTESLLFRRL